MGKQAGARSRVPKARRTAPKPTAERRPKRARHEDGAQEPAELETLAPEPVPAIDAAHPVPGLRVIEAPAPSMRRTVGDFWRHRSALGFFFRLMLRKRYGRTFLGYLWFFIPILLPMLMGALVFGGILGVSVGTVPYFLYFVIASSAWLLFAQTAFFSVRSLEMTRSDLRKVYVPRLTAFVASMTLPVIAMAIYVLIIACVTGFYVIDRGEFYLVFGPATLLIPAALAMLIAYGFACGLWFAPLAPRARDVRRLTSNVLALWYFITPVIYPIDEIPESWRFLASLNPITAPIEIVKEGLLDIGDVTTTGLVVYFGALVVATVGGLRIFNRAERRDVGEYY